VFLVVDDEGDAQGGYFQSARRRSARCWSSFGR
jgi:hypothetical protein